MEDRVDKKKAKLKRLAKSFWKEWKLTIFIIVFVVIPVKSSLGDFNWVPTGSMNPTILEGDLLFVNKVAYDLRFPLTLYRLVKWSDPERGDIVICFSPDDGTRLVKRIVALPGDTIAMRNNMLFLNGRAIKYSEIDQEYAKTLSDELEESCVFAMEDLGGVTHPVMSDISVHAIRNFGPVIVPKGHYFVLGDNRDKSKDSRMFGFVERKSIVGKAIGLICSFNITDKFQPRFKRFLAPLR
jgi:signal peptidase I